MSETIDNNEDVSGLKNKNRELHGIIKNLEAQVTKLTGDVEDAAENARADAGTELDKANRRITKLEKERDDALSRANQSDKGLRDYKASNALTSAIASANVDSAHVAMLSKALRADIEFDAEGEPTIEGKSIADFTKHYFANAGKSYVRVADHNGGGASGSDNSKPLRLNKDNFNFSDFARIQLEDPEEANAIADAVDRPELKTGL